MISEEEKCFSRRDIEAMNEERMRKAGKRLVEAIWELFEPSRNVPLERLLKHLCIISAEVTTRVAEMDDANQWCLCVYNVTCNQKARQMLVNDMAEAGPAPG